VALFSQLIRTAAITGRTDYMSAWFADRQSGRWVEQTMASAMPRPEVERALKALKDLHKQGDLTDDEFERLRARVKSGH
jgi:hypothetical protein